MGKEVTIEDIDNPNKEVEKDEKEVKPKDKAAEPQYVTLEELTKIQKQLNGLSYIGRKMDEMSRKMETFSSVQSQPVQPVTQDEQDEYDKLVEKDWKAAVRKLASEEAAALRKSEREAELKAANEQRTLSTLEQSKKAVVEKYPDLNDDSSEMTAKFKAIMAKNPHYLQSEYGPILTMRDMEDELRAEGKLDIKTKLVVDKEVERRTRVGVASVPKASSPNTTKATMTADERAFCDFNGIKYATYLEQKRAMGSDKKAEE